uniref:Tripartite motif-containing protein 2 n=1 Tax=Magallana gigas TaxID=29159 RepID=K1R892_MAGGI|eukprot:XP_019927187.1 PREDICTED: uncharacterized protein LOC105338777 [Crassostrea gigas]
MVTKVMEYRAPLAGHVSHISLGESGRLWLSYGDGQLVQTDLQGKRLPKRVSLSKIKTSVGLGFHTVTKDGDLVYTNKDNKTIMKVTPDNRITLFIDTGNFKPLAIHSSRINGDFLVGMMTDKKSIVRRYNKTGKAIQRLGKRRQLFNYPHFITENINGDICTSDYNKRAVVVVDKIGRYRFSFTGHDQKSVFRPSGICTDIHGRIIVCSTKVVDILDGDGQWLCALKGEKYFPRIALDEKNHSPCTCSVCVDDENNQSEEKECTCIHSPRSVCVDDENNLHVGLCETNNVVVFKYLQ